MVISGGGGVAAVVLLAAVLHAAWNAIAKRVADPTAGIVVIAATFTAIGVVVLPFVPVPLAASWPWLALGVVLQTAYNLLLGSSYRHGDFSQVYPLARGTSPLVVALAAAAFVGEPLARGRGLGVLIVTAGLVGLVLSGGVPRYGERRAVLLAIATGLTIATYTVVDGVGVRRSGAPVSYAVWLLALSGPWPLLWSARTGGRRLWTSVRAVGAAGLAGGVLSAAAYTMVLWAQTRGTLASVSALRETSVLFAAAIGAVLFHEPFGRGRALCAGVVVLGIAVIELA